MRKIVELKPLTRVEGHNSVRVYRNGRRAEKVELALCESPLVRTAPEDLRLGLRLKAAANLIQETVGGRLIHPVTLIPGIMGHRLQRDQILGLRDALARLNLNTMPAATALPEYDAVRRQLLGAHIQYNSLAQAIKLFSSLSRAIQPIDQILNGEFDSEEPPVIIPRQAAGCAAMEAPRGTLIHYYRFDSRGVYTGADIITPTAINQASMELDL